MNILRGEVEVEIGGKTRLVKFGTNQLAIYTQKHKLQLSQVDFGMSEVRDLIWSALVAGAKKQGQEIDFDEWQVGDWIDEMPQEEFDRIMECFGESMPKAESGQAKKK